MKKIIPLKEFIKDESRFWEELINNTIVLKKEYHQSLLEYHIEDVVFVKDEPYVKYTGSENMWLAYSWLRQTGTILGVLQSENVIPPEQNIPDNLETVLREALQRHSPPNDALYVPWNAPNNSSALPTWKEDAMMASYDGSFLVTED